MSYLRTEPITIRKTKEPTQSQIGIGRNGSLIRNNLSKLPSFTGLPDGRQGGYRVTESFGGNDQIGQQALILLQVALVFGEVASLVRLGQDPLNFGRHSGGMRQRLEGQITLIAAVTQTAQSIERQRVAGVIG